ncbi:ATP-dependent helicase [Thermoleptolyngbya sp. C42_A2020_037]|uniref:ATP-dependent helicase n=1 Tax=Thermoleptolyngbya sp. C42_A2020_037 TaxID=2747799 RepID=UPI0019E134F4|nr:ATP-dependent helicase [Thermoleptolyngbya sp. C42_A2020_037]MBF2083907.1 ATP-dependent helicase [Thermoleptolyngbya sp. C42_A2020_037]
MVLSVELQTLETKLEALRDRLRPGQQRMADWTGGPLAVSAVPGSGKSTGMAIATAILLGRRYQNALRDRTLPSRQIFLVTFTRSAAANLRAKIRELLKELGLPTTGFSVYTLHGLALNIASRHPDLSELDLTRLTLITPERGSRLIKTAVEQWSAAHPDLYRQLLEGQQADGEETERLRRRSVLGTEILPNLANTAIHEAKSSGLSPDDVRAIAQSADFSPSYITEDGINLLPNDIALQVAAGLYEQYETLLHQRSFLDYDDMILAALRVLQNDEARQSWQQQVYAVFEDEAQDSSPLQTRLLELLAADPHTGQPNLVRVGDPNQAINSTFTPADPLFFREFCAQCQQQGRLAEMDQAGRSTQPVIDAANFLVQWVNNAPDRPLAASPLPFRLQAIRPVPPGDPQADSNPPPEGEGVEIRFPPDIYRSVDLIAQRVAELFAREPEARAAVLVRENRMGRFVANVLRNPTDYKLGADLGALGIAVYEVGERDRHSHVPGEILTLLQFCDRPHSPDNLKAALRVLADRQLIPPQDLDALSSQPEDFLYPGPLETAQPDPVVQARRYCAGLLRARVELPQFQLIPFLALTLNYDQTELATADKLAARIAQQTASEPSLQFTLEVLSEIVQSERFEPVETEDIDTRYVRPKQLTIITMHKAKGLDWDFVFLPFLQQQTIPGKAWVPPAQQFLGEFDLAEVARAQIRAHVHQSPLPDIDTAWQQAQQLKIAEEYRLLYVAMTRARRLLWMAAERQAPFSWANPSNLQAQQPTPVLNALMQTLGRS